MEKISGIIPSSARVTSVDLKESFPVRAGTPGFGRAEAVPALRERGVPGSKGRVDGMKDGIQAHGEVMGWRSKESQRAGVAQTISDQFFMNNRKPAIESDSAAAMSPGPTIGSEELSLSAEDYESPILGTPISMPPAEAEDETQFFPKGSFIDYQV